MKRLLKNLRRMSQIVAELNKSWEFAKKVIDGMSNADFAKPLADSVRRRMRATWFTSWLRMRTSILGRWWLMRA